MTEAHGIRSRNSAIYDVAVVKSAGYSDRLLTVGSPPHSGRSDFVRAASRGRLGSRRIKRAEKQLLHGVVKFRNRNHLSVRRSNVSRHFHSDPSAAQSIGKLVEEWNLKLELKVAWWDLYRKPSKRGTSLTAQWASTRRCQLRRLSSRLRSAPLAYHWQWG